jgi:tryptophan-rich sensory protein
MTASKPPRVFADVQLAAWLFVPYLAWVSFATVLCGTIAAMNS